MSRKSKRRAMSPKARLFEIDGILNGLPNRLHECKVSLIRHASIVPRDPKYRRNAQMYCITIECQPCQRGVLKYVTETACEYVAGGVRTLVTELWRETERLLEGELS